MNHLFQPVLGFAALIALTANCIAQLPSGWKAHDWERPNPRVVMPGESNLPLLPPSDAVVLFDGSGLENFRDADGNDPTWVIKDNVLESVPGSGYLYTAEAYGDVQLHVEWASPSEVIGDSQGRGNSGVFLMGLYEVQVLDSFENKTYADGQAAAMYGQFPPLVNVSRKPGVWQSYDVVFHQPKFDSSGRLLAPATMTVLHNGVLVQDNTSLWGPTAWIKHEDYKSQPNKLPLSFQDHGNPVRYRNIWLRELAQRPYLPPAVGKYNPDVVFLSDSQLNSIVGQYGDFAIRRDGNQLLFKISGREHEMIPHSPTEFSLRYTAATIRIDRNTENETSQLTYEMGGGTMMGTK